MNSPDASHQGGAWERLIRSVRSVLNGMAIKYKGRLDTQTLRTAFHEAAAIVNSRPLTATSATDPQETIITPNHLLTMKSSQLSVLPPGQFASNEIYGRTRWKMVQQFAQEFWETCRQKWTEKSKNIKVGDVVLLKEDSLPRNQWKIGIVDDTHTGDDGLVRNVTLRMANCHLNKKGKPSAASTILNRPVQKLIVLVRA